MPDSELLLVELRHDLESEGHVMGFYAFCTIVSSLYPGTVIWVARIGAKHRTGSEYDWDLIKFGVNSALSSEFHILLVLYRDHARPCVLDPGGIEWLKERENLGNVTDLTINSWQEVFAFEDDLHRGVSIYDEFACLRGCNFDLLQADRTAAFEGDREFKILLRWACMCSFLMQVNGI